jgi:hypothetical protein
MKKTIIRYSILLLIAVFIFILIRFVFMKEKTFDKINYKQYTQLKSNNKTNYIYITSDDFKIEEFEHQLVLLMNEKNIDIKKLDVTKQSEFEQIISDELFIDYFSDSPVFPNLIIMKYGKIVNAITYSSQEELENIEVEK